MLPKGMLNNSSALSATKVTNELNNLKMTTALTEHSVPNIKTLLRSWILAKLPQKIAWDPLALCREELKGTN